jgi:GNAT superfamily N-acetyltransferase
MKIAIEPVAPCLDEIFSLASRHFESLGKPYSPSRDRYLGYEASGNLFLATVRDGGQLAGFALMYLFESMHDQTVQAQEDLFYLLPEYRLGWTAIALLNEVEEECRRRGCAELKMTAALGSKAGAILSARHYATVSEQYCKSLVRADSPSPKEAVRESLPVPAE